MRYLLLIIGLMYSLNLPAAIYQSKDKQGVIHFSDTPIDDGQITSFETSQIYHSSVKNTDNVKYAMKTVSNLQPQEYKLLQIEQPQNEITLRNDQGEVEVRVKVEPALNADHYVIALLDGKQVGQTEGSQLQLTNVDRGSHVLQLQIQTKQGEILARSNLVNFYMQRSKIVTKS